MGKKMKPPFKESISSKVGIKISWHPAFVEALQMELYAYRNILEFHSEFPLTSEPLRIDCVVIKKAKDVAIKKNIAAIYREWNLIEYKSPSDYVSVADFYKVYGYACLYASFERVPITSLTISFVESRYPKKLLEHLQRKRGYSIAENSPGIYTINGDILPIQVIDSQRLSAEENLWLRSLSNKLNLLEVEQISTEIAQQDKAARIAAYLHAIAQANPKSIKEAIKMANTLTIEQVFEDVGWTAKWEARGRAEGEARGRTEGEARGRTEGEARGRTEGEEQKAISIAQNMVNLGFPIETVVSATQLNIEKVRPLYK
jgi:hypothetical protein